MQQAAELGGCAQSARCCSICSAICRPAVPLSISTDFKLCFFKRPPLALLRDTFGVRASRTENCIAHHSYSNAASGELERAGPSGDRDIHRHGIASRCSGPPTRLSLGKTIRWANQGASFAGICSAREVCALPHSQASLPEFIFPRWRLLRRPFELADHGSADVSMVTMRAWPICGRLRRMIKSHVGLREPAPELRSRKQGDESPVSCCD